jgi:alkanesulfonate monooxygenase SsuD/methylene tetrahydromethanopterin reductase-like flavin-dependent oxidoreductase (luciferase family)
VVGSAKTVRAGLERLIEQTQADEIIATAQIYEHGARLRSFEITAGVFEQINAARGRETVLDY